MSEAVIEEKEVLGRAICPVEVERRGNSPLCSTRAVCHGTGGV